MRDIFIKNITSPNHRRKTLSITEMIEKDGVLARAEKKFCYFVCEKSVKDEFENYKELIEHPETPYQKKDRHVSIKKIYDNAAGVGQMVYRVIGSFYIMHNFKIFAVVFMHSIKFDMLSESLAKNKSLTA